MMPPTEENKRNGGQFAGTKSPLTGSENTYFARDAMKAGDIARVELISNESAKARRSIRTKKPPGADVFG
jgi:hypothetical protein